MKRLYIVLGILVCLVVVAAIISMRSIPNNTANIFPSLTQVPTSPSQTFNTKDDCLSHGGTWQRWGLAPEEFCQIPMKDAGKICTDNSECSARKCLADTQANASSGYCAQYNQVFGCYATVEHGKISQAVCVD